MNIIQLNEGIHIFLRRIQVGVFGFHRYGGSAQEILKQIIEACWNKKDSYFMTSTGHFSLFYMRDFGWCTKALLELGYKEKVSSTLHYALVCYEKKGRVTTTITAKGTAFDFPRMASDSLPYLIRSLRYLGDRKLIAQYKTFLEREVQRYYHEIFDPQLGLVRKQLWLSSVKDHAIRNSSTYDNCMCMMIKEDLDIIGLTNPFAKYDIKKNITKHLFNGSYFYNDLDKEPIVYGDANTFPFVTGFLDSKLTLKKCITSLEQAQLTTPFPLKYQAVQHTKEKRIWQANLVVQYETHSIWMHMMPLFLCLVKHVDENSFTKYLKLITTLIEREKNYLEVYDHLGKPLRNPFYVSDEGMIWASMLLALLQKKEII